MLDRIIQYTYMHAVKMPKKSSTLTFVVEFLTILIIFCRMADFLYPT